MPKPPKLPRPFHPDDRPLRHSEPRIKQLLDHEGFDSQQRIETTLVLRRDHEALDRLVEELLAGPVHMKHHFEAEELHRHLALDSEDLAAIETHAGLRGLEIVDIDPLSGSVRLAGTLGHQYRAFGVEPVAHDAEHGPVRSHLGQIQLPEALSAVVEAVLGLDEHPADMPHAVVNKRIGRGQIRVAAVARHYRFPDGDGSGQKVGVILLGGGIHESDLDDFFAAEGIPRPTIVFHEVGDAKNQPADDDAICAYLEAAGISSNLHAASVADADAPQNTPTNIVWTIEASMDVELIGGFAPGAEIHVYFAPNTSQGKFDALSQALADGNTVVNMSFGGLESSKSESTINQMEGVHRRAALSGVTLCVASGDTVGVQYPASSPYVLACGGTHLHDDDGHICDERVWNEQIEVPALRRMLSSGGVSEGFPLPRWQRSADLPEKTGYKGRGVPDVAAKADLKSGYAMVVGGQVISMGGTSAAAPLWSGLIARINQLLAEHDNRAGYITPYLYAEECRGTLHSIGEGFAGIFSAGEGWDPCTGLGSPDGRALLQALLPPDATDDTASG